jgi:DNA-binding MarR family transcriptional regulator
MLIADSTLNRYDLSFEDICEKIKSKVGSRTSIQNIIKIGLEKKYFDKKPFKNDARRKIITLSDNGLNEFREFIKKDAECYYYLKDK